MQGAITLTLTPTLNTDLTLTPTLSDPALTRPWPWPSPDPDSGPRPDFQGAAIFYVATSLALSSAMYSLFVGTYAVATGYRLAMVGGMRGSGERAVRACADTHDTPQPQLQLCSPLAAPCVRLRRRAP